MGGLSSSQWRCSELLFCSWQTLSQSPTLLSIHKFPVLCDEVNLPGRRWACWRYCFIFANVGLSDEVWKNSGTFGCLLNLGDFCREEKKIFCFSTTLFWRENAPTTLPCFSGYLVKFICSHSMALTLVKGLSINSNLMRERCQRNEKPTNDFPPYQSRQRTCSVDINSMSGNNDMLQQAFGCT